MGRDQCFDIDNSLVTNYDILYDLTLFIHAIIFTRIYDMR